MTTTIVESKKKPGLEDPGQISSGKTLLLHTREALKIFKGRTGDKEQGVWEIPGLPIYGVMLRVIWGAALGGDLYANLWVKKLEENLRQTKIVFDEISTELDAKKAKLNNRINLSESEATHPVEVQVEYASPYMYLIIYKLIELDELAARLITLRHIAIINPNEFEAYIKKINSTIKTLLNDLRGFKHTGVTTEDVEEKNARYNEAVNLYGELPEDIKEGLYIPEHMPQKRILGFAKSNQK